jgi:F-type H+-transporting ATPase subunit delta
MFGLAIKQNTLDRTRDDVKEIGELFALRKLAYLLREPKIPTKRKETALRQALEDKVLPTSLNLALLVVQRELVDIMPNIAKEFEQMVLDYRNEAIAQVTTAAQLDGAQKTTVKQALEKLTNKKILMQTRVDPSILGGVVARVGDQIIDGSIRQRLLALQQQLLTGVASADIDFLPEDISKSLESAPSTV